MPTDKKTHHEHAMRHHAKKTQYHTLKINPMRSVGIGQSSFLPTDAPNLFGFAPIEKPPGPNKAMQAVEGIGSAVGGIASAYQGYKALKARQGQIRDFVDRLRSRGRQINDPEETGMDREMEDFEGQVNRSFNASEAGDSEANFFTMDGDEMQASIQRQIDNEMSGEGSQASFRTAQEDPGEADLGDMGDVLANEDTIGGQWVSGQTSGNAELDAILQSNYDEAMASTRFGSGLSSVPDEVPSISTQITNRFSNLTNNVTQRLGQWNDRITNRIANINRQATAQGEQPFEEFGSEMQANFGGTSADSTFTADSSLGHAFSSTGEATNIGTDLVGETGAELGGVGEGLGAAAETGGAIEGAVGIAGGIEGATAAAAGIGEAAAGITAGAEAGEVIGEVALGLLALL